MARDHLTDIKIRQAKPALKPYKLADGLGLFLLVNPNGARYWRLKYRFGGKERLYAVGVYPEIGLGEARSKVAEARRLIREGIDPVADRKRQRIDVAAAAETFQTIAEEWIASRSGEWSPSYRDAVQSALAANVYPPLSGYPIRSITVPIMREALLLMERRGALASLRKVRMWTSGVFRYAIATGRAEHDPAAPLRGTFKAHKPKKFAAVTKAVEFAELISRLRAYNGSLITRTALLFLAYTFVRTGELREAQWSEFDFNGATWRIPAERMKMKEEHIVPLAKQSVKLLTDLRKLTGHSPYVFPNDRRSEKPMSENTILFSLYRLGYHGRATGHGFRASASTLLNEMGFDPDVVERQLAHRERNRVRAAYHRAEYIEYRREMMQSWTDYIDRYQEPSNKFDISAIDFS
ncbi:tyrosine-type recombinase/integrase [Methylobacterium trifolii]|uniref:Prophage integrase IntS n=1 Tax=Methylobacterium trifolii TaxID=1003092 RepID=A0ABQ4TYF9_9HYPH|nr:integrase arm-type DNA-binding domain-containing protein [Methylobacterium trifolii]GJE60284.1 Prophage integrase IntS [Methylobacterium trifolii]